MPALRVLHVASFSGNIGDNANHMGFRPWFESLAGRPVAWTNLEIREFYWKERQWDAGFVALANAHDLLVIGGGNYFELWVENSPTGTSIAIAPELFDAIRVPVYFNALGVDPGQGVPQSSLSRFRTFLDKLLANERYLVSVRNDGAACTLQNYLGETYARAVARVPDAGFFVPAPAAAAKPPGTLRIGINVASDMPEARFRNFGSDATAGFAREMATAIMTLAAAQPASQFVLFPHIFRDIDIIFQVIAQLGDRLRRTRLAVAPYGSGDAAALAALSLYASCDAVLAMRFHANVCPLGMGVQTLGLNCYPQIANLYRELEQPGRAIDVASPGFAATLAAAAEAALTRPETFPGTPAAARQMVEALRREFEPQLTRWMRATCV
ncbi:MAG: polysaccharide pyruvyl transferase family protein [Rhodocyclaceae bacterium]|nr:polysaccharide pyruvyl transferase family protein [Rhodocyclaceae bacterium]